MSSQPSSAQDVVAMSIPLAVGYGYHAQNQAQTPNAAVAVSSFCCISCYATFNNLDEVTEHWKSPAAQDQQHKLAADCCKGCPTREALGRHLADQRYHNYCFHCQRDYGLNRTAFMEHIESLVRCPFSDCGKTFQANQIDSHLSKLHHYCKLCLQSFSGAEEAFHDHCKTYHFCCAKCARTFTTAEDMQDHFAQSDSHHFCPACQIHFKGNDDLLAHYANSASWAYGKSHAFCVECSRDFYTVQGLREHFFQDWPHNYCIECSIHYATEADLTNHFRDNRGDGLHFFCDKCSVAFRQEADLTEHIAAAPTAHFHDSKCLLGFPNKAALVAHMSQSPEHNYCEECDRDFEDMDFYHLHYRKTHAQS
ncbi:hypothetical protein F4804DRAFT_354191 [Jackrogersella minutella]|nr:hypothetical protein F4804DRAFT_354191 [Jackrogersella minutella]